LGLSFLSYNELRNECYNQDENKTHNEEFLKCALHLPPGENRAEQADDRDENYERFQPVQANTLADLHALRVLFVQKGMVLEFCVVSSY